MDIKYGSQLRHISFQCKLIQSYLVYFFLVVVEMAAAHGLGTITTTTRTWRNSDLSRRRLTHLPVCTIGDFTIAIFECILFSNTVLFQKSHKNAQVGNNVMNQAMNRHEDEERTGIATRGRADGTSDGSHGSDGCRKGQKEGYETASHDVAHATLPETTLTIREMEQLASKAKMFLSFQERTRAMEEMHGIAPDSAVSIRNPLSRNPEREFLQYRQRLLEIAANIVGTPSQASTGIHEPDLMWAFLQSCSRHSSTRAAALLDNNADAIQNIAQEAASKYVEYRSMRDNIFTVSPTPWRLKLGDLAESSKEILQSGCFQVLPQTDTLGRRIVVIFPHQVPAQKIDETSMVYIHSRGSIYFCHGLCSVLTCCNFPETQMQAAFFFWSRLKFPSDDSRDCVLIYYEPYHPTKNQKMTKALGAEQMQSVLAACCRLMPVRLVSLHICVPKPTQSIMDEYLPPFWKRLSAAQQTRSAFYFVNYFRDFQQELRRFGVHFSTGAPSLNTIAFPLEEDGSTVRLQTHLEWLRIQQAQEDSGFNGDDVAAMSNSGDVGALRDAGKVRGAFVANVPIPAVATFSPPADAAFTVSSAASGAAPVAAVMAEVTNVTPTETDVLFGRGMAIQRHNGNIAFRNQLEANVDAYYAADNVEKVILVDFLYHTFQGGGVRFLRHELRNVANHVAAIADADSSVSSSHSSGQATSSSVSLSATSQQDIIYNGRWTEEKDKKAIHSKFCQTFRSIRAAQRRAQQKKG
jgi:hypothetical protein